jgi:predicted nucleic-acid-binding Zn-ribbon protein
MRPKNGKIYTQEQLLKGLSKCPKCGNKFPEWEERGESGIQKRLVCLACDYNTEWYFQSIACIQEWRDERK